MSSNQEYDTDMADLRARLAQVETELDHWRSAAANFGHTDAHSWSLATDDADRIVKLAQVWKRERGPGAVNMLRAEATLFAALPD